MKGCLFDTDLIIEYLRGNAPATDFFRTHEGDFYISAITIAELLSGVKGKKEKEDLDYFLSLFIVLPVSKDIATDAGLLRQKWHRTHGMGLSHALFAATAAAFEFTLYSLNEKHYGMLEFHEVPYGK